MNLSRRILALVLTGLTVLNWAPFARACGPESLEPIFVFHGSPDIPFAEFTRGKIGIVQPSFGRKTLVIAYRYLNGNLFNEQEQASLVDALQGKAPEDDGRIAMKAWVAARREFLAENETLPQIYAERRSGSYDFFPNCARNAFEVATSTLKDRAATYGATDQNVHEWLAGQDVVFQNCSGDARLPPEATAATPTWLRKDRDYQIAAALFYSLNFDQARQRFQLIAADPDSPWQEIAAYLVARTLLRQASLAKDDAKRQELYQKAEVEFQNLAGRSRRLYDSSQKLIALIKYHLHPEDRVRELAATLSNAGGNENVRQDLIDYVWLLDRFETAILKAEKERNAPPKPPEKTEQPERSTLSKEAEERNAALSRGDLINIGFTARKPDLTPDYSKYLSEDFKYDASEAEILQAFELTLGRKLLAEEVTEIKERREAALEYRNWLTSPNRKWDNGTMSEYEGCEYECERLQLNLVPDFLRTDDLSEWIFTLQTSDQDAYNHALARWRETGSRAWLVTALIKAGKSSPHLAELMRQAEKVEPDAAAFPSITYHLVRLHIALGNSDAARKLLDEVLSNTALLPISAVNQFLQQRVQLAAGLTEFLKYTQRRPVAFVKYGVPAKISGMLEIDKALWDPAYTKQTREEYERQLDADYQDLLPWDDRFAFDNESADILNWRFSLQTFIDAGRNPNLPSYLQRQLLLASWTRAILLKRDDVALRIAPDVIRVAPELESPLQSYLDARTLKERRYASLFILLRFPNLSPFVTSSVPSFSTAEQLDYYFESTWWCTLPDTEYNREGNEVPKIVSKPAFLTARQLDEAEQERKELMALGDGKSFLGKQVLQWAEISPGDPRLPEALFIAFSANTSYKYGCGGWESDPETQEKLATMLRERYPASAWTAKLPPPEP